MRCEDDDLSSRSEERLPGAIDMMDDQEYVFGDVRGKISNQLEFDTFSLASQILMFADPVPDDRIKEFQAKIK